MNACVEFRVGGPENNAFFVDVLSKQETSGEIESKDAITGEGDELQLLKEKVDDFMRKSEKMEIDLASVRSQVATLTMEKRDLQAENERLKNQLAHAKQRRYDNLKKLRQRLKERKESRVFGDCMVGWMVSIWWPKSAPRRGCVIYSISSTGLVSSVFPCVPASFRCSF